MAQKTHAFLNEKCLIYLRAKRHIIIAQISFLLYCGMIICHFFLLAIFVKNHIWKMIDTSKHFKESYRAAELFLCKKKVLKIWVVVAIVHNNAINFRTMKTLVSHVGVFRDFFCQGLGVDLSRVDMNGINMVTCCQSYYFSKVLQICYFPWIIA